MKRIICIVMALMLVVSLCACTDRTVIADSENLTKEFNRSEDIVVYDFLSQEHTTPENYEKYSEGAIDFGVKLLAENVQEGENVVISPASVSSVLALLANGAQGKARNEIKNLIATGSDADMINTGEYYLNSRLTAFNTEDIYYKSVNSLWFNDAFDVKSSFLQSAVNYYDAGIFRIDFGAEDAATKINGWVSENTHGTTDKVMDKVDAESAAVAISAAVINDVWATPYHDLSVSEGVFHGAKGDTQAQFMTSREHYISSNYGEGFVKGFENVPCKFAALLPKEGQDITEFAQNLSGNRLTALLESQTPMETCTASLPEFTINTQLELADSLKAMGIKAIFDEEKADFSSLSNTGKVYISQVVQDAFLEINAQGAVTSTEGVTGTAEGSAQSADGAQRELIFDRPFVFVIFDNESNIPVFMGVVNNIE